MPIVLPERRKSKNLQYPLDVRCDARQGGYVINSLELVMTATPHLKPPIRDSFGPLQKMQEDLTDGSINPVTPVADLVTRYETNEFTVRRALHKALIYHGACTGQVLVMLDPGETRVLAVTPDPAEELGTKEMEDAGNLLVAQSARNPGQSGIANGQAGLRNAPMPCPVYSMPAFDYRVVHGAHVAAVGNYVCDIAVAL
jgi:hypothetical protein